MQRLTKQIRDIFIENLTSAYGAENAEKCVNSENFDDAVTDLIGRFEAEMDLAVSDAEYDLDVDFSESESDSEEGEE